MENKRLYRIYTRWVAVELRRQGFRILGTDINEHKPEFNVYLFENSKEFQTALSKLSLTKR